MAPSRVAVRSGTKQLYDGAGEVLARAFELAFTPVIMGFIGHLVDRWAGTGIAFTVALALFSLAYLIWKLVAAYEDEMRAHEAALVRTPARPAVGDREASR